MSVSRARTVVVSALAAAVAIRVTAAQPVGGAYARIAADPSEALRRAGEGWTAAGTLGDATAQGLREIPLAGLLWVTDAGGVPPAAGRTIWCAVVLVLAAVGAIRMVHGPSARRLRADAPSDELTSWTPWVGAALFACAPVLVATVQHSPADGLAAALLPWVLGPLVRRETGWRAAARSAAWLGLVGTGSPGWAGAVLAVAIVAAVVPALTGGGTKQLGRWVVLAAASSAWWLAALVWESAHATDVSALVTSEASTAAVSEALGLGGTSSWWLLVLTVGPLLAALATLLLRIGPNRALVGGILVLVAAVSVLATVLDPWRAWLPVRAAEATTYDTVPVVFAPLLLWTACAGLLAWSPLVDHLGSRTVRKDPSPWTPGRAVAAAFVGAVVLATAAGPVVAAQERSAATEVEDVGQWSGVAEWSASAPPGRVLVLPVVPDSRGATAVAEALDDRPWVGRDVLPLSEATGTAALDDAIGRLSRGQSGAGTAAALEHLGISYVLLRNDVAPAVDRERPLALVRHALASQGASRVAVIERSASTDAAPAVVDQGVRDPLGNIEIWALDIGNDGAVRPGPPLSVAGTPAAVGDLADAGLGPSSAIRLAPVGSASVDVVSDTARRRDIDQRAALDPLGPVLDADQDRTSVPPGATYEPTAHRLITGATGVRASSSAADLGAVGRRSGERPSAAVDGNAFTSWQSRAGKVVGEWWEIDFEGPTDLSQASVVVVQNVFASHAVTQVELVSDNGSAQVDVPSNGTVPLSSAGRTQRLRVRASAVRGTIGPTSSFGIAELQVPGLDVVERLAVTGSDTATWVLSAEVGSFATCVPSYALGGARDPAASETACNQGLSIDGPDAGNLSRVLSTDRGASVAGRAWVRAADSAEAAQLADRLARPSITATGSSVASPDLTVRPQAAVDADPRTAWRPSPEDEAPTLELEWRRRQMISGLRILTAEPRLSSPVSHVVVRFGDAPGRKVSVEVGEDGEVSFTPVRTRSLSVELRSDAPLASLDSLTAGSRSVPVALSEVEVVGGPTVAYDIDTVDELPCGSGPDVSVDGESYRSAVTLSAREVVEASVVTATVCDRPSLPAGDSVVEVEASYSWTPLGLVLSPPDGPLGAVDSDARADDPSDPVPAGTMGVDPDSRRIDVSGTAGPARTLVLAVPAGKGWTASAAGKDLRPLTVDGWAQAWEVPEGAAEVSVRYSAGESLRLAAGGGVLGWAAVLLLLAVRSAAEDASPVDGRRNGRRAQAIVGRSTHA